MGITIDNSISLPLASLVVAGLAVFFGPLVTLFIAKRQIATSLAVSNKQIIAPMRQAWINSLRDLLAEMLSSTLHYYVSGFENRDDAEYQRLQLLESKIELMLNPNENDHEALELAVREMVSVLGKRDRMEFPNLHKKVTSLARHIFKQEWNRVRDKIEIT